MRAIAKKDFIESYLFNSELFYYLLCLKHNKKVDTKIKQDTLKVQLYLWKSF